MMDPRALAESVAAGTGRGGQPCATCRHPKRNEVEKAALAFSAMRKKGSRAGWASLCEKLREHYGYDHDHQSLLRHLRKHLGEEVT